MTLSCLIVDDSRQFLEAATNLLEHEGIAVLGVAETGDEAIELAARLQPDVILADIDMATESGFALARRLKIADGSPVILISAHSEEEFSDMVETSPAIGFIPKASLSASEVERCCTDHHRRQRRSDGHDRR
jgi:DNA-binding NarL/FixJ family response regulator